MGAVYEFLPDAVQQAQSILLGALQFIFVVDHCTPLQVHVKFVAHVALDVQSQEAQRVADGYGNHTLA